MYFLEYFILGSYSPILTLYMREYLKFTGPQMGLVLAMSAGAAFLTPSISSFIVDRVISKERLFSIFHLLAAGFMILLSFQTQFIGVLLSFLAFTLMFNPTLSLANAITFHHLPGMRHKFGGLRAWGAVGWVCVAWFFSFFWLRRGGGSEAAGRLPDILKLCSFACITMFFFSFSLPVSHVKAKKIKSIFPVEAFKVIKRPQILLLIILSFLSVLLYRYYSFGLSIFLKQFGIKDANIMPVMSMGQILEIITLGTLGYFLIRFKYKRLMIFGIIMAMWRFAAFSIGGSRILIYSGILCHGFIFGYLSMPKTVYLDTHCEAHTRASVFQIFTVINLGFGRFIGNLLTGWTMKFTTSPETGLINFRIYWLIPLAVSIIYLFILIFFFERSDKKIKL